jgi:hypothetical protein
MDTQGISSHNISRLLSMKGRKRLQVKDDFTEFLLEYDYNKGLRGTGDLVFLQSRDVKGDLDHWTEYDILIGIKKIEECPRYLSFVMFQLYEFLCDDLSGHGLKGFGIQEVECSLDDYYYILFYAIR